MNAGENFTGGPAFPIAEAHGNSDGMTLRDYFAAKALQGLLSDHLTLLGFGQAGKTFGTSPEGAAVKTAYQFADAMLAARAK